MTIDKTAAKYTRDSIKVTTLYKQSLVDAQLRDRACRVEMHCLN